MTGLKPLVRFTNNYLELQFYNIRYLMLHTGELVERLWAAPSPTFADMLWQGLSEQAARRIPSNGEHSIAWTYWHLARIEDTAFNLLMPATRHNMVHLNEALSLKEKLS